MSGPESVTRLAVYGTLAPGRVHHGELAGLGGTWSKGTIRGRLTPAGGGDALGFPALILDSEGEDVEVFLFSSAGLPERLPQLDAFEGPGYRRAVANVRTEDGVVKAFVYVLVE